MEGCCRKTLLRDSKDCNFFTLIWSETKKFCNTNHSNKLLDGEKKSFNPHLHTRFFTHTLTQKSNFFPRIHTLLTKWIMKVKLWYATQDSRVFSSPHQHDVNLFLIDQLMKNCSIHTHETICHFGWEEEVPGKKKKRFLFEKIYVFLNTPMKMNKIQGMGNFWKFSKKINFYEPTQKNIQQTLSSLFLFNIYKFWVKYVVFCVVWYVCVCGCEYSKKGKGRKEGKKVLNCCYRCHFQSIFISHFD